MIDLDKLFDGYAHRARLMPGLFVLLPLVLGAAAWFPLKLDTIGSVAGVIGLLGGASLLTQCVRDRGKAIEASLFVPPTLACCCLRTSIAEHGETCWE
jgi:hypothetical protein